VIASPSQRAPSRTGMSTEIRIFTCPRRASRRHLN
jgi:hypothetical protein